MANHMPEIARMLGVELGEKFKIENSTDNNTYYFTEKDIVIDGTKYCADVDLLRLLICGIYTIKRKPWKPSDMDIYYVVMKNGAIKQYTWTDCTLDYSLYKLGNCYCTREQAEANRDKWVAFYASDEVLEV